ncbi:periplasmic alpha-amylase [Nonlabens ulvanivorans]|uniref:Periplasmic alpha-amylase n=1 Tax=Nonlabens ulvanivorans TaxID=906888 RepID=A0A081DB15_NONUL|nr:alpha-amylase family glycosyl hydrolase [Nonlabens ulvanivorans]GAK76111.1 periplasmic alpha-amylase [Nonlabens ulvanivorans]
MKNSILFLFLILVIYSCKTEVESKTIPLEKEQAHYDWSAANVYFLLTDRFKNGDVSNDTIINRNKETGKLRGFKGGDFAGIIEKIDDDYFTDLGVNAIWLTPIWEQIHDGVDEGTGYSYAFHGYWAKDWTAVEPSYGTQAEFESLVQKAHDKNIRILLDVVINHTGPVTDMDPVWPADWVRTGPSCTYQDQETAVSCTLTDNLPDIRTDSKEEVELPEHLVQKWRQEGRLEAELKELDDFFNRTGLPRTPVNYIIKWVTDYARETGVDGFRIDTVKHVEEEVWKVFNEQATIAYEDWKKTNPEKKIHDDAFFILGELYGYEASGGRKYFFNDNPVDYFDYGYDAMINFGFKRHAIAPYKELFKRYDGFRDSLLLENPKDPAYFMNYISSHDDGQPFDAARERTFESATKLLLSPGMTQIYYGDEIARPLIIEGTQGDATLRSVMDWDTIDKDLLSHWQKLGKYRNNHPAVGAGSHHSLEYDGPGTIFARWYVKNGFKDQIIAGAGLKDGSLTIDVTRVFKDLTQLRNAYTGTILDVIDGKVTVQVNRGVMLLESF